MCFFFIFLKFKLSSESIEVKIHFGELNYFIVSTAADLPALHVPGVSCCHTVYVELYRS